MEGTRLAKAGPLWGAILASALLLSGCYSYSVATGVPSTGTIRVGRGSVLFWGLMGVHRPAPQCPHGLSYMKTWQPWWSVIVRDLTLGIVTPWRAEYECALGQAPTTPVQPSPAPPAQPAVPTNPFEPAPATRREPSQPALPAY